MKFYRKLKPFKAISFDLDDTLYDNHGVMHQAEQQFVDYLNQYLSLTPNKDVFYWRRFKQLSLSASPELTHNVTLWREHSLTLAMVELGFSTEKIKHILPEIMSRFMDFRCQVTVPNISLDMLTLLQRQWPLIAITNGNVDIHRIGLTPFFSHCFHSGGNDHRKKPYADMFHAGSHALGISPNELLHIGDCLTADVTGALDAGCQALWFNPNKKPVANNTSLPHGEYHHVSHLSQLILSDH